MRAAIPVVVAAVAVSAAAGGTGWAVTRPAGSPAPTAAAVTSPPLAARAGEHVERVRPAVDPAAAAPTVAPAQQPAVTDPAPAAVADPTPAAADPAPAAAADPTPATAVADPAAQTPVTVPDLTAAPAPPAQTPAAGAGNVTSPDQATPVPAALYRLLLDTFGPAEVSNALAVARCESSWNPSAAGKVNPDGSRDWGLFQLNDHGTLQEALAASGHAAATVAAAQEAALNPAVNVAAAKTVFDRRGWTPWTCAATTGVVDGLWSQRPGPNAGRYLFVPAG